MKIINKQEWYVDEITQLPVEHETTIRITYVMSSDNNNVYDSKYVNGILEYTSNVNWLYNLDGTLKLENKVNDNIPF